MGRADGAVLLVAAVVTLSEAVAAPRHGDAVDVSGGTGELLRGAGWGLYEGRHHIITRGSHHWPIASQASSPAVSNLHGQGHSVDLPDLNDAFLLSAGI